MIIALEGCDFCGKTTLADYFHHERGWVVLHDPGSTGHLFLHLSEALESKLNREVTACDHHSDAAPAHGLEQHAGERFEGLLGLDFEGNPDLLCREPLEFTNKIGHVLR